MLSHHLGCRYLIWAAPIVIQLSANTSGSPCARVGDMDEALGFWFQPGPALNIVGHLGIESVSGTSLSLLVSFFFPGGNKEQKPR